MSIFVSRVLNYSFLWSFSNYLSGLFYYSIFSLLFTFIKYTQPAWQFNIEPKIEGRFASCNVTRTDYPAELSDERFETESARLADIGYRLWNKGVLLESTTEATEALHQLLKPSLRDE